VRAAESPGAMVGRGGTDVLAPGNACRPADYCPHTDERVRSVEVAVPRTSSARTSVHGPLGVRDLLPALSCAITLASSHHPALRNAAGRCVWRPPVRRQRRRREQSPLVRDPGEMLRASVLEMDPRSGNEIPGRAGFSSRMIFLVGDGLTGE
jgi:hypothetical protein